MPGVKLVGNITTGVVLLYGGYRVLHGQMTIGTLAAFLLYLRMFFEPMQEISQFFNTFQSASSALEKLAGVLAERPGIKDPERPVALEQVRGDVAFHDVQFAYVPERPVLPDLSFSVPAGQTVALVGTTGAGKTTIAKLIARFYDPTSGAVTLDGVDLRDLAQSRAAPPRRDGDPGELHVRRHRRRQHPVRPPRRHRRRSGDGRRRPSARTGSSTRCPTATTPTSPSAAAGSRPGSASWSRSPARSSPTLRC